MRWEEILYAFSDWRLQFLAVFVLLTLIVAGTLTIAEQRIRKKRRLNAIRHAQERFVYSIREKQRSKLTLKEKLDFIDELAKNYFAEVYGTPVHSDYSYLKETFTEKKEQDIINFCDIMFNAYYLKSTSEQKDIDKAYDQFITIYARRKQAHWSFTFNIDANEEETTENNKEKQPTQKSINEKNPDLAEETKENPTTKNEPTRKQVQEKKILKKNSKPNIIRRLLQRNHSKPKKLLPQKKEPHQTKHLHKKITHTTTKQVQKKIISHPRNKTKHKQGFFSRLFSRKKKQHKQRLTKTSQKQMTTHKTPQKKERLPKFLQFVNSLSLIKTPHKKDADKQFPTPTKQHPPHKRKDSLTKERSEWLQNIKKRRSRKKNRSTGTDAWLKDVREALSIK